MEWKRLPCLTGGWRKWLSLPLISILVPGGTIILLGWLAVQCLHFDDELAAYAKASFAESKVRAEVEDGNDECSA